MHGHLQLDKKAVFRHFSPALDRNLEGLARAPSANDPRPAPAALEDFSLSGCSRRPRARQRGDDLPYQPARGPRIRSRQWSRTTSARAHLLGMLAGPAREQWREHPCLERHAGNADRRSAACAPDLDVWSKRAWARGWRWPACGGDGRSYGVRRRLSTGGAGFTPGRRADRRDRATRVRGFLNRGARALSARRCGGQVFLRRTAKLRADIGPGLRELWTSQATAAAPGSACLGPSRGPKAMRSELPSVVGRAAVEDHGLSEIVGRALWLSAPGARRACTCRSTTSCSRSSTPTTGHAVPRRYLRQRVSTTPTKEALPLLRHLTGDIASVTR